MHDKEYYMNQALLEAEKVNDNSIPIGCVIVDKSTGEIVSRKNNNSLLKRDPFSHAELKALQEVAKINGNNYLNNYELYVTLEPCLTCFSMIRSFSINEITYGASNEKYGFSNFIKDDFNFKRLKINKNIKNEESISLLQRFFKKLRNGEKE